MDSAVHNDLKRRLAAYAIRFVQANPRAAHQLTVLWLKYINELDDVAIGKQLDKSALAVQVQRSRGLARLRRDPDMRALATDLGLIAPHSSASL
jgi:hypothetical protein